ncbi:hypothetical protein BOX15_Mlig024724g1 [Macrostomum lignano]|uniref:Uncharacterized protein n=1 Tax=Macrostomum lignano TaxID=282301 RepID=A0A267DI53_9PLAT|nr:hypothetical protein BOX15_Mlig024724g1 [Macrostomum lignano]
MTKPKQSRTMRSASRRRRRAASRQPMAWPRWQPRTTLWRRICECAFPRRPGASDIRVGDFGGASSRGGRIAGSAEAAKTEATAAAAAAKAPPTSPVGTSAAANGADEDDDEDDEDAVKRRRIASAAAAGQMRGATSLLAQLPKPKALAVREGAGRVFVPPMRPTIRPPSPPARSCQRRHLRWWMTKRRLPRSLPTPTCRSSRAFLAPSAAQRAAPLPPGHRRLAHRRRRR